MSQIWEKMRNSHAKSFKYNGAEWPMRCFCTYWMGKPRAEMRQQSTIYETAKRQHGFTLMELTVVVGVILTIAAIAVPNFMRSKVAANEASAVTSVRMIHSVQVAYSTQYPALGFADTLAKLGPPPAGQVANPLRAALLDSDLGCDAQPCRKHGYEFRIDQTEPAPITSFRITAVPLEVGRSGQRGFCGSSVGMITADLGGGTNCVAQAPSTWLPE